MNDLGELKQESFFQELQQESRRVTEAIRTAEAERDQMLVDKLCSQKVELHKKLREFYAHA